MTIARVGLVQMECSETVEINRDRTEAGIRECVARGANIVCLQELFTTLYFCRELRERYFDWAEPLDGPTTARFIDLARELGVVLVLPFFEKRAAGLYHNSAVVIDADGSVRGAYRKMHIPHDPGFEEKYYFSPGDLGFRVFDTAAGRVAVLICWDQWFPEGARLAALAGAQIVFYPTAIGWKPAEPGEYATYRDAWMTGMRAHAIHNGLFVAAVNRVGIEHEVRFWGHSFVADPLGRVIGVAGEGAENPVVDCDLDLIEATRRGWPFLRDRRIDAYTDLTRRFIDD